MKDKLAKHDINPLYFDYCAATPIDPDVLEVLINSTVEHYANASSAHSLGLKMEKLVNQARESISNALNVDPSEVIFTSGATESNNLALFGVVKALQNNRPIHIITTKIEHPSVMRCTEVLKESGVEVTYLPVDTNGVIHVNSLKDAIKDNTILVSIIHVNNETGVIQPIEEIGAILEGYPGIYFHVDGVQGFGKVPLSLNSIDLYTISAHKIGGPKGVGLLIKKKHVNISPIIYGGNQEFAIRPGTTNITGVLSMAEAIRLAVRGQKERLNSLNIIYHQVYSALNNIDGLYINSPPSGLVSPHILNFSFKSTSSAIFLAILAKQGIIASSQSACSSKGSKESRVLMAISNDQAIASSSVRISFHETNKEGEIIYLIEAIKRTVMIIENKKIFSYLADKSFTEEKHLHS